MATIKQIEANRRNAKLSTGPKTESGKKWASQNAVKHGQLSRYIVLKSEAGGRFNELLAALTEEFQPATPNEQALVETMAVSRWRLMRNWTLQTGTLEVEIAQQDPEAGSPPILAAMAFKSLADNSNALHLLQRYETANDRQYARALSNLLKARANRIENPPPDQPKPALVWRSTARGHPSPVPI